MNSSRSELSAGPKMLLMAEADRSPDEPPPPPGGAVPQHICNGASSLLRLRARSSAVWMKKYS